MITTNHEKNEALIKQQLLAGKRITVLSVLKSVGTIEARHYLSIIRRELPVSSEWVTKNGKRFKEYFIKAA
jgi:hypothetical protein